nr:MAG TPA: hypothetical protein [Bacteriophage sp.]
MIPYRVFPQLEENLFTSKSLIPLYHGSLVP